MAKEVTILPSTVEPRTAPDGTNRVAPSSTFTLPDIVTDAAEKKHSEINENEHETHN